MNNYKLEKPLDIIASKNYFTIAIIKGFFLTFLSYISFFYCSYLIFVYIYIASHLFYSKGNGPLRNIFNMQIIILSYLLGGYFWLFDIEMGGLVFVLLLLILNLPFLLSYFIKLNFIIIYIIFECILNILDISVPMISLGAIFSNNVEAVHWYNYTTLVGGSFWLLITGYCFRRFKNKLVVTFLIILPIIISFAIKELKEINFDKSVSSNVLILDASNEKDYILKIDSILKKNQKLISFVVLPEVSLRGLNTENFENSIDFFRIKKLIQEHNFKFISGVSFLNSRTKKPTNGALVIEPDLNFYFQSKKKMVLYTEFTPNLIARLFGARQSYYYDNKNEYPNYNKEFTVFVCYEAFYPFYFKEKSQGSDFIFLLSSEEFLGDSNYGRKYYNNQVKLRSVENGKTIFKSTTGGENLIFYPDGSINRAKRFY